MATADLTVIALGRAEASASRYIAEIQRRLERQDQVRYSLHAMGTSLEGSTADILAVVAELHAVPFEMGIPRVYSVLKLDERRDREQTLEDKVESVRRLARLPSGDSQLAGRATASQARGAGSNPFAASSRAGEGNRTPISGLGSPRLNHWTTPARGGRIPGRHYPLGMRFRASWAVILAAALLVGLLAYGVASRRDDTSIDDAIAAG